MDIVSELLTNGDVETVVVCVLDSSVVCPGDTAAELVSKSDAMRVVVCVLDTSVVCAVDIAAELVASEAVELACEVNAAEVDGSMVVSGIGNGACGSHVSANEVK